MDRPGEIDRDSTVPLASKAKWGVEAELSAEERKQVLDRVAALTGQPVELPSTPLKAGEFAVFVARLLTQAGQP